MTKLTLAQIYYITGGQRSGKSRYAQDLARQLSDRPVYLATSRIWDDDHRQRINRHQQDRDDHWTAIEEEKYISRLQLTGRVVLMDCVTLWLTNFFTDHAFQVEVALKEAQEEFDQLIEQEFTLLVVSNEIGMGIHPATESGRKFADLQGWMNQYIARKADKAVLMVSGLPLMLK